MIRRIGRYLLERMQNGIPRTTGVPDEEVLFLVDGVGGFQFCAVMVRRALRLEGSRLATVLFDWQCGLTGEIFTDLCWHRRNRYLAAKLARTLRTFRREHPHTKIHLFAVSAGTGIAVFACEQLGGRRLIDTLVLACPALSPTYNLAPALRTAIRTYGLVSTRDSVLLGLGTRIFGTVDREFTQSAGRVGFSMPKNISDPDKEAYARLGEIRWSAKMRELGNKGGHSGWVSVPYLRRHLLPMVAGRPLTCVHSIPPN